MGHVVIRPLSAQIPQPLGDPAGHTLSVAGGGYAHPLGQILVHADSDVLHVTIFV